jgi:hypothetical protein
MGTTTLASIIAQAPSVSFVPTIGAGLNVATSTAAQLQAAISLAVGSSAGQCNIGYIDQISVTTGTPFTLNLITGNEPTFGNAERSLLRQSLDYHCAGVHCGRRNTLRPGDRSGNRAGEWR